MHGEVLTPVVSDRDFQVVDAAALRLERVRQVWRHVQHVLQTKRAYKQLHTQRNVLFDFNFTAHVVL